MSLSRFLIALIGAATCACAPVHMAVPPDLAAGSHVYEVQNRSSWKGALVDESFNFGPYRVTKIDRDWTSSSGWGVGAYSTSAVKTGYAFVLVTPAGELAGRCGVEAEKKDLEVLGGHIWKQRTSLACACGANTNGTRFVISSENGRPMGGAAVIGENNLAVNPIDRAENGAQFQEGLGWELRGVGPIGAVEAQHPGRFWLEKGLAPTTAHDAACLLAGMALYQPPEQH
ncbi:MAG: hypothetical protein HY902_03025 [Deltaproteobacteria bacterium]|nr:hypothetical protein [Deltaproteobacteria bacterium]